MRIKKVFDHFVRNPVDLKPKVDHRLNDLSRLNPQNYQLFHGFKDVIANFIKNTVNPENPTIILNREVTF